MITIEKKLDLKITYPLENFCSLDKILFFDIETTGFSGDYSNLYLIGCTFYKDNSWQLIQWFADDYTAEEEILHAFFRFLEHYSCLIHFNGDGFDIPYLLKRCCSYALPYNFSRIESIDIYRLIKPLKKLMGLSSLKQKSIENFLGISRDDTYNGGQLIEVYHEYLRSQDPFLYKLLVLHNEDDLKGMPSILPILYYPDFLKGSLYFEAFETDSQKDIFGNPELRLILHYKGDCALPVSLQIENNLYSLEMEDDRLTIIVSLLTGELKRFYPDYQNYFYLTCEDNAIHKSVGQFVDKDVKKKATARTCYTRISGTFLPQPASIWEICLKADYKDKLSYVPFTPELFSNENSAVLYAETVLKSFI